jgi:hypothetical protein
MPESVHPSDAGVAVTDSFRTQLTHGAQVVDPAAGNDLVGGVGSGALHVEAAECLEQLQSGGNEQRLPMRLRRVLGRRSPVRSRGKPGWRNRAPDRTLVRVVCK